MRSVSLVAAFVVALFASASSGQAPSIKPELAGIGFLLGNWSIGRGAVADTGGTATGSSKIELAANGAVLLRRDRTNLFDAAGKPAGGFEQIMMIYPEGGELHAEYSDGTHVIHYTKAAIEPGHSVIFTSAVAVDAPVFKLAYTLRDPRTLDVAFAMAPPGSADFHPIASGSLNKDE